MRLRNVPGSREAIAESEYTINEPELNKGKWRCEMVDYKRLGERIAQTRKSQKLSQEKLAELADITATNLSHIERGKIKTSIETLVAIANALNVTSNDLLCDSLNHSTQELKNQIAACLDGCTMQELHLIADVAAAVKKRMRE